jgi:hypothetical protein
MNCTAIVSARRRACTSRKRVARVSRVIGKSDTTAKRACWQVGPRETSVGGVSKVILCSRSTGGYVLAPVPFPAVTQRTRHTNATPLRSGVSQIRTVTGLPWISRLVGRCHHACSGSPGRLSLCLRSARWRLLLPGACWSHGCSEGIRQPQFITGTLLTSNSLAVWARFVFSNIGEALMGRVSIPVKIP